jgi:hypothetical protein
VLVSRRTRGCLCPVDGSHVGSEATIQTTESNEFVFVIPSDPSLLNRVLELIFKFGVQQDPTIHVEQSGVVDLNALTTKITLIVTGTRLMPMRFMVRRRLPNNLNQNKAPSANGF